MRRARIFCVVDPNLKNRLGHDFEYDYSLMRPATERGFDFLALAHYCVERSISDAMPVRPSFHKSIWDRMPKVAHLPRPIGRKLEVLLCNIRFMIDLRKNLPAQALAPDSVVFGHMITVYQLLGWALWFRTLPVDRVPRVTLLFRYQADWFRSNFTSLAFWLMASSPARNRLTIASDSEQLAEDYSRYTDMPIAVLPIPHTAVDALQQSEQSRSLPGSPITLISLGNARDEKGYQEILEAILLLHSSGNLSRFKFVLQSNDLYAPETASHILQLTQTIRDVAPDSVEFISRQLDSEEYYSLLRDADAALLPYWRSIYRSRTSGILTEALAAGKPVVVTDDTWMSRQVEDFGSGVVCRDRDPVDLVRAILDLEADFATHSKRSASRRMAWLERHNPAALAEALVSGKGLSRKDGKRIAVLYPWGDIAQRGSGASQRVGPLLDLLKTYYPQIRVLSMGQPSNTRFGNVEYVSYHSSRLEFLFSRGARLLWEKALYLATFGSSEGKTFMLWQHYRTRVEPGFVRRLRHIIRWADVVMLEYTFWSEEVSKICREYDKQLIVTDYDVVSNQILGAGLPYRLTAQAEVRGLLRADHAVCVSTTDQEMFRKLGAETKVIPHGIDTTRHQSKWSGAFVRDSLDEFYDIRVPDKNVCLFVGSYFQANLEAVQAIREIASSSSPLALGDRISFLVAGGCASPERNRNFLALGRVSEEVLDALYQLADLILIPLRQGTGASVKTIEAMAFGKPVLGTRVAFRGYPVEGGVHCIISDNLAEYPCLIADLLRDHKRRSELGRNARTFAEKYDYRLVYQRYIDLIEGRDSAAL